MNAGPSHPAIYLPSAAQKRKDASLSILDTLKSANKSRKGQAQASTLTASDKKEKKVKETKTKDKLPIFMEGYWGPLIRSVTSIDGSTELQATHPGTYTSMTKSTSFKYNKTRYFWWLNNYMYFPNIDWHAIKLEGVFEGDIENYKCETQYNCTPRYLQNLYVPEFLFAEIEQQVVNQLMNTMKIPAEDADNKLNILR